MLLLRALLLEFLVCFHVIGGAVIFRRLFPRESPWLAYILPTLIVMCVCNSIEHFIPLTALGFLLPFTIVGLGVAMLPQGFVWRGLRVEGYSREGLWFPGVVFLAVFSWVHFLRCLNPDITCNGEAVADMARVLDFSLGTKLPAIDSWCPPYDHGGYYTFQHYGTSLLKRLFTLDIGTGYNMGYTLLNTLTFFVGTGAAFLISGRRIWVALGVLLILLANWVGSSPLILAYNWVHPVNNLYHIFDSRLADDIGDGWNDPARNNPFGWIFRYPPPGLRLFLPSFNTYFPEFHANLGGHFLTLASLLAANEAFSERRTNWPWICLILFPVITIITSIWFLVVTVVLCVGAFAVALIAGHRPNDWRMVLGGSGLGFALVWPAVDDLISGNYPVEIHLTPWTEYTAPLEFLIQWWPIILAWVALFFVWNRMNLLGRFIHAALPLLLIFIEVVTISSRTLMVEKMWGACYGAGLVTLVPLVFVHRNMAFRFLTAIYLLLSVLFLPCWFRIEWDQTWPATVLHLQGNTMFTQDDQKRRILQVLKRFHGTTMLDGRSIYSYSLSPSLVGFSENRCYIAWFFQEFQCGHGGEAEFRDKQSNEFYDGKMADPLAFLRSNDITAVVIFPDDKIPDGIVNMYKDKLASDYYYIDCRSNGENNAGVFVRNPGAPALGTNLPIAK